MLGGELITISGPTFKPDDNITCIFGTTETVGAFLTEEQCICVVPEANNNGLVNLDIQIVRGTAILSGRTKFRYSMYTVYPIYDTACLVLPVGPEIGAHVETEGFLEVGRKVNVSWDLSTISNGLLPSNANATINISMVINMQLLTIITII